MAVDTGTSRGVLLRTRRTWESFKNSNGETIDGGEAVDLHVYDAQAEQIVGPITVPRQRVAEFLRVDPYTSVEVEYEMRASNNRIKRSAVAVRVLDQAKS